MYEYFYFNPSVLFDYFLTNDDFRYLEISKASINKLYLIHWENSYLPIYGFSLVLRKSEKLWFWQKKRSVLMTNLIEFIRAIESILMNQRKKII